MKTRTPLQPRRRRAPPRWRRALPLAALAGVTLWATLEWFAQNQALAWTESLRVRVVPVIAPDLDSAGAEAVLDTFLNLRNPEGAGIGAVRYWLNGEFRRFSARDDGGITIDLNDAVRDPPAAPSPRAARPGRIGRLIERQRLMRYFRDLLTVDPADADVVLYVYFYTPEDRGLYSSRSLACRASREGVVFVPVDPATLGYYQALFAHELCHTLGARDKYDEHGSTYPQGYAEPVRLPLYPQTRAEIMALAIPKGAGREAYVEGVRDCVVGDWTAREMGWESTR